MKRNELIELIKATGGAKYDVFIRGDNDSIISVDDVIVIGDGNGKDEICLINGAANITVEKAINGLCPCQKIKFKQFLSLWNNTELIEVVVNNVSDGVYTIDEISSQNKDEYFDKYIINSELRIEKASDCVAEDSILRNEDFQADAKLLFMMVELTD